MVLCNNKFKIESSFLKKKIGNSVHMDKAITHNLHHNQFPVKLQIELDLTEVCHKTILLHFGMHDIE